MTDADSTSTDSDPPRPDSDASRIEVLRQARQRQPWTVELLAECGSDPAAFKEQSPACAACPAPCEADEVCATAVAKSGDLLESMGREQAFHLIENAAKRLRTRDDAELRTVDRERPNTFVTLDSAQSDATAPTDERDADQIPDS